MSSGDQRTSRFGAEDLQEDRLFFTFHISLGIMARLFHIGLYCQRKNQNRRLAIPQRCCEKVIAISLWSREPDCDMPHSRVGPGQNSLENIHTYTSSNIVSKTFESGANFWNMLVFNLLKMKSVIHEENGY